MFKARNLSCYSKPVVLELHSRDRGDENNSFKVNGAEAVHLWVAALSPRDQREKLGCSTVIVDLHVSIMEKC